jgi:hypothetical protein
MLDVLDRLDVGSCGGLLEKGNVVSSQRVMR